MTTLEYLQTKNVKVQSDKLTFGQGNAKLDKRIATFSLPSGFSCPGASECLSRANRQTGNISDGQNTVFRCFSASQEALFPNVRKARWNNLEALKGLSSDQMADIIDSSLPLNIIIRLHVAGDFFSQAYFDAWLEVAKRNPEKLFYAYTKSLPYWIARKGQIPSNLKLNASFGGKFDHLISEHKLKFAKVVFSVSEAKALKLEIDHDDSHAFTQNKSFALLLHGTQAQGSEASKALSALRVLGLGGYPKK